MKARPLLSLALAVLALPLSAAENAPFGEYRPVDTSLLQRIAPAESADGLCRECRLDENHYLLLRDVGSGVYIWQVSVYGRRKDGTWTLRAQGAFSTAAPLETPRQRATRAHLPPPPAAPASEISPRQPAFGAQARRPLPHLRGHHPAPNSPEKVYTFIKNSPEKVSQNSFLP